MTWMLTATGEVIDLKFIAQDSISIEDVAHHLAQMNRYDGAAKRPISVAEHSLNVVEILRRECFIDSPSVLLAGLMHDAHEFITGDMKSPMKELLGSAWTAVENRIQHAVLKRFELITIFHAARTVIDWADATALATERKFLLPDAGPQWEVMRTHNPLEWIDYEAQAEFTWLDWRHTFLQTYAELNFQRSLVAEQLGNTNH